MIFFNKHHLHLYVFAFCKIYTYIKKDIILFKLKKESVGVFMKKFSLVLSQKFILSFSSILLFSLCSSYAMEEKEIDFSSKKSFNIIEGPKETSGVSVSPSKMPFKLGFEFQEASGLCPWAINDNNVQKKPLILFKNKSINNEKEEILWHVEIDSSDIEFVTKPFTYKEKDLLKNTINSILESINILKDFQKEKIYFDEWYLALEKKYSNQYEKTNKLKNSEEFFMLVPKNWKPQFSPQATIQHPLEYAIPLYFSLFGFNSPYMINFSASLPFRDIFLEAQQNANSENYLRCIHGYQQKMNGLVFLHALTLVSMGSDIDDTDEKLLEETKKQFKTSNQVDPKIKLAIMSRRPFSSMLKDIHNSEQGSYYEYFMSVMKMNFSFSETEICFNKTNYAEQFFDENGKPKSLAYLLKFFEEEFLKKNKKKLTYLLEKGIISTTMLRNIREDVKVNKIGVSSLLNSFFERAVKSVEYPEKARVEISISESFLNFSFQKSDYDILSPPLFLDKDNSMGRLRDDLTEEEKAYGEAIVEIRAISSVQPWFLKKCKLDEKVFGEFLTDPFLCKKHSLKLFNFLENFGTQQDILEIYYLGMPYALRQY